MVLVIWNIHNVNFFNCFSHCPMIVLAQHGEFTQSLPVVRIATHKLLVYVDAVDWVELLATNLSDKHMAIQLSNFVLVRRCPRLESLVTDVTGGILSLSLLCFVPSD